MANSISVQTLFDEFKKTREYTKLATKSKSVYDRAMKYGVEEHFLVVRRVSLITERFVDELYQNLLKDGRHSHANMFMKVMRRVWSVMRRKGLVTGNPFREMGIEKTEPRTTRWTKEQLDLYFKTLKTKGYFEVFLLAKLCYVLGQRPGDMARLTKRNFSNGYSSVSFKIQKTGKGIQLPILDEELKHVLAAYFKHADQITKRTSQDISVIHRYTLAEARLPSNLQIRDLRRTALMEIFEAGGTDAEGQAVSAHSDRSLDSMLNVYSPYTYQMAENAMRKRFGLTTG